MSREDERRMGRYCLHERLGIGGMGVVFRAVSDDGDEVALKMIRPEYADDTAFRRHLAREVAVIDAIHSRYVPAVVDSFLDAPIPWFAMNYVEGPSLTDVVAEIGPLESAAATDLAVELSAALDSIHSAGVLHRDVKPANVLMYRLGPVLIDFGIAAGEAASGATVAHVAGSPAWMAPEEVTGEGTATAASDVFAAALTIAYAATGRSPYGEGAAHAFLYRVVHTEPDLTGVPELLRAPLLAALDKDPARRPTAAGLRQMILGAAREARHGKVAARVEELLHLAA